LENIDKYKNQLQDSMASWFQNHEVRFGKKANFAAVVKTILFDPIQGCFKEKDILIKITAAINWPLLCLELLQPSRSELYVRGS